MARRIRRLVATLAVLLGTVVTPASAAAAPQLGVSFSRPSITGSLDDSLQRELMGLIDLAAPQSTLRVATYVLELPEIENKLVAAAGRGVDVRVVGEAAPAGSTRFDELAARLPGRVTLCQGGCVGPHTDPTQINHQKFFVFSALTDGRTDVVAQTSQNLSDEYGLHQNMLISSGDSGLANGYRTVFTAMVNAAGSGSAGTLWKEPFVSSSGKVTVWMQPRNTTYDRDTYGSADLVAAMIRDVGCPGSIRIVQSQFATDRVDVINELIAKRQAGCEVKLLTPEANDTAAVAKLLAPHGIGISTFRPGGCVYPAGGTCSPGGIHSKIILVDGPSARAGGARKQYAYTGSQNFNRSSLVAADDSFVRIDDPVVYQAYATDFSAMAESAVKLVPATFPNAASQMTADGPDDQREPRSAPTRNGYSAVTWEDDPNIASVAGTEVYARIYRNGAPVTGPVKVSSGGAECATGWNHVQPSVGVDNSGNAYIAWAEDGDCRGEHNIAIRRLSPSGALGTTTWANDPQWAGEQSRPTIAVRGDGAFTVAWEDAPTTSLRAAGYATPASRTFGPVAVTAPSAQANRPAIAMDQNGTATLAWQQWTDIYMGQISASGTVKLRDAAIDPRVPVNTNTASQHLAPAVAVDRNGNSVIAWSDNVNGVWRIRVRGLAPSMSARFTERAAAYGVFGPEGKPYYSGQIEEYPPMCDSASCAAQGTPFVGVDDNGRFVVSWTQSDNWNGIRSPEVYARGFNADGSTTGRFPAERMNPLTTGAQSTAPLAVAPDGGFMLFYAEDLDKNNYRDLVVRPGFSNTGF